MITSTTTDYAFRKMDVSLHPDLRLPFTAVSMRLGNPVRIITGQSKAAQNFLRCLMTPLGHYRSNPGYGTEFSERIYSGSVAVTEDLPNVFATESLRVLDQVFDPKIGSAPDDEIVARAELSDFKTSVGQVSLEISLYFRNEDTPTQIRLPIILDNVS